MAAHPRLLAGIGEQVREHGHHVLAVALERVARGVLQQPIAEQGHERRHEDRVARAHRARAGDRLARHGRVAVVNQRNQQPPERRILDVRERAGRIAAAIRRARPRVANQSRQRAFGGLGIARRLGVGQLDRGRDHHARVRVVQMPVQQRAHILVAEVGQRAHRRRAHVRVVVLQHRAHGRQPALGLGVPQRAQRLERARANARRFVMQQQRRDQVPLVERLQHLDGVQHRGFVRVRELLDQRFDRGGIGHVDAHRVRLDLALVQALRNEARYSRRATSAIAIQITIIARLA